MRLILYCALCLCAAVSAFSQKRAPRKPELPLKPTATQSHEEVRSVYDKIENRTNITVGPMPLKTDPSVKLSLLAQFSYEGQTPPATVDEQSPSGWIYLVVLSNTQELILSDHDRMVILADEDRLVFPKMKYESATRGGKLSESRALFVSQSTIKQLANASKLEGRIGIYDFSISSSQAKALKDFLSALPPAR